MAQISIGQFNRGGLADSKYSGYPSSLRRIVGFDLHSEPGVAKVNQKLSKVSGTTVTHFCREGVACSDGNYYVFSNDSGEVYKVTPTGTTTLAYTTVPSAGSAGCLGAREYIGYLYWATQNRLHRIPVSGLTNWAANAVPNYQTFANGDASFHPMMEQNLVLYIGDGRYVAQVETDLVTNASVFSSQALDLAPPYRISALGTLGTDLLVGTYISDLVNRCAVFRFDTSSPSYSNKVEITEPGIFSFLTTENMTFVFAGYSGSIYRYDGAMAKFYRKFPGTYSSTQKAKVNPASTDIYKGNLALAGFSNVTGNPADGGIYSLGHFSDSYPFIMTLEFPLSLRDVDGYPLLTGIEIGAVIVAGTDVLVAWRSGGSTCGVDLLDSANKLEKPYLETMRLMSVDERGQPHRVSLSTYKDYKVAYADLPANTSFLLKYKQNYNAAWQTDITLTDDSDRKLMCGENSVEADTLELRLEAASNVNAAPVLEELILEVI